MSPAKGFCRIWSIASRIRSRSLSGTLARDLSAGPATRTVQLVSGTELIQSYEVASGDSGTAAAECTDLFGSGFLFAETAHGEVRAERLAHQLGTGTVLDLTSSF